MDNIFQVLALHIPPLDNSVAGTGKILTGSGKMSLCIQALFDF